MAEPEKPTILQSIRRYTNTQISSVLHSLIGVPSMLQPPTFSDMDDTTTSTPNTTPTSSQSTTPSGEAPQPAVVAGGKGDSKGERMISEEWKTIERQLFLQNPEEVFSTFLKNAGVGLKGVLAEEMFWPRSGFEDVWLRGMCRGGEAGAKGKGDGNGGANEEKEKFEEEGEREKEVNEETELDAYAQLLPLSTRPENKTIVGSGGRGGLGVVSSVATTRSVTVNGVTKTEYMLKRRFSDGQEEMLRKQITRSS
ncbi:hypothetical protein L873DRAFT_1833597 [Choiromyces venosus 120613-1]|uniref:Uncharacterized protein n=1 Tax=Choiromyces venosus 120613-1 TaxID=1336337 RepID=A0A3N4JYM5_9PEZI|nr:hypothetical protein L873DRAFT_1833597 [Choiromyces venosus 120613-1]